MSVTVEDPSARVCAGVDWAKDDHAICIVDADGKVLDRFAVEHTAAGLSPTPPIKALSSPERTKRKAS